MLGKWESSIEVLGHASEEEIQLININIFLLKVLYLFNDVQEDSDHERAEGYTTYHANCTHQSLIRIQRLHVTKPNRRHRREHVIHCFYDDFRPSEVSKRFNLILNCKWFFGWYI